MEDSEAGGKIMKNFWLAGGLALLFLTATSGWALAQQITPSQGVTSKQSISQAGKGGKGHRHGCHGKCNKNGNKASGN